MIILYNDLKILDHRLMSYFSFLVISPRKGGPYMYYKSYTDRYLLSRQNFIEEKTYKRLKKEIYARGR